MDKPAPVLAMVSSILKGLMKKSLNIISKTRSYLRHRTLPARLRQKASSSTVLVKRRNVEEDFKKCMLENNDKNKTPEISLSL